MEINLKIPDELLGAFKRMMNFVPVELRDDIRTQKMILVYLKLGGIKLARQGIEVMKNRFREKAFENPSGTQASGDSRAAATGSISESQSPDHNNLEFPTK